MTMLAVVVLIPIAIMIAACLLERFEARTVTADPSARASRNRLRTPPAARLSLVADTGDSSDGAPATVGLDTPTADLRKVS